MERYHFCRYELKYLINRAEYKDILRSFKKYMNYDKYSDLRMDKTYDVTSTYYEGTSKYCYYEKVDGIEYRKKFRLRDYYEKTKGKDLKRTVYFEIKRKHNNIIIKDRFPVEYALWQQFIENDDFTMDIFNNESKKILEEFLVHKWTRVLKPLVKIHYKRTALTSEYHENLRVTFDKEVECIKIDHNDQFSDEDVYEPIDFNLYVMEIKFTGMLPHYIHDVLQRHELTRDSVSKYCLGLEKTNIVSDNFNLMQLNLL